LKSYEVIDFKKFKNPIIDIKFEYDSSNIFFISLSFNSIMFWRFDSANSRLLYFEVESSDFLSDFKNEHFTSLELTPYYYKFKSSFTYIGTNKGNLLIIDKEKKVLLKKIELYRNAITKIVMKKEKLIIFGENPSVFHWDLNEGIMNMTEKTLFNFVSEKPMILYFDHNMKSSSFTYIGNEGIVSTQSGNIYYVNFTEKSNIKIFNHLGSGFINNIQVPPSNNCFISCSENSLKVWNQDSFDCNSQLEFVYKGCGNFKFNDTCNLSIIKNNGMLDVYNTNRTKLLGKIEIPFIKIENFDLIFNSYGLIISSSDGRLFVIDIINWEGLKLQYSEISSNAKKSSTKKIGKKISVKNISQTKNHCLIYFNNTEYVVLCIEKLNTQIASTVIDVFSMFSQDPSIDKADKADKQKLDLKKHTSAILNPFEDSEGEAIFSNKNDNYYLFINENLKYLFIRDYIAKELVAKIDLNNYSPRLLVIDEFETSIAIGTKEGNIIFFHNISQNYKDSQKEILKGHYDTITSLRFNRSADLLFSGSYEELFVWKINN